MGLAFGFAFALLFAPRLSASEPPAGATAAAKTEKTESAASPKTPESDAFFRAVNAPTDEPFGGVRRHYMWSNERRHDVFFEDVRGRGGGYLGVGGDQNYTIAAAAGSTVIWLVDIDREVIRLHKLYSALLKHAETPDQFIALFDRRATLQVEAALGSLDAGLRKSLLILYTQYRADLLAHLRDEISQKHTWLGDGAKYAYLRKMAQSGLIVPRLGDLNGPTTLLQISEAAKQAHVVVRVMYLSNAESWFGYGDRFRRNVSALPFDEQTSVVRTIKSNVLPYVRGDVWHYTLQKGPHFVARLAEKPYSSIDQVMLDAEETKEKGFSHVGFSPEKVPAPGQQGQDEKAAARMRQAERLRRQKLLADGIVTRPAGNRECAAEFEQDRKEKAEKDLKALEKRLQTPAPK